MSMPMGYVGYLSERRWVVWADGFAAARRKEDCVALAFPSDPLPRTMARGFRGEEERLEEAEERRRGEERGGDEEEREEGRSM